MKKYIILLAAMLLPVCVFAQGTTSGTIEGIVLDAQGEPLPSANVLAIHQPTGTRYGTATRLDGRYTIKNVRVGGPYEVRVTFVGYNPQRKQIESIGLNETLELNFEMEEGSLSLDQISVTAEADPIFNADRTGASTNITTQKIESLPTISRSITDFGRLIPQNTGGNSFGGRNDRYNNILIDGATLNDVFGLGDATPGSQAGAEPISLDAIAELNIDLAPYDVTNNNFTGGQLNAITRSGTNEYSGSLYFLGRNENFVGSLPAPGDAAGLNEYPEFGESFYGFRLGGPIKEDELFFFVSGEFKRRDDPLNTGVQGSGAGQIFDVSAGTMNEIQSIAEGYGYDPGGYGLLTQEQDNNKFLAKLDWNISEDHRLTVRHNYVNATDDDGIFRSDDSFDFSNRQYIFRSVQNSTVAELNSSFGDNVFNTARLVYTNISDERDVQSEPFPEVTINTTDADGDDVTVTMGIDRFSQANRLEQDLFEFTNNLTMINGAHEWTFGTSNQLFFFENLFIQDFWGSYEFGSIEAFRNGEPSAYRYSYSKVPGVEQPIAEFSGLQFGLYAQDKWRVSDEFSLTLGLRADMPVFPEDPLYNPDVQDAFGYDTRDVASGNILWSPRLGFNYDTELMGRLTQFRGGTGIFSGSPPYVWLSNQYSNTGSDFARIDVSGSDTPDFNPDPDNQPRPGDGSGLSPVSTTEVNVMAEDFKFPQTWRTNLAMDHELPWNMTLTLEGIYSSNINDVVYENLNLENVGTGPGGRPLYGTPGTFLGFLPFADFNSPARVDNRFTNALLLKNTNEGYEYSLTAQLQKQTDFGLSSSLSYTFNEAKSVTNATSSRAISNWQFNENFDINDPQLGTADFEIRHRILADISYRFEIADGFLTTLSVIYEGSSGRPFSWIYFGDANGDGQAFNDLVYVPASMDEVQLVGASGGDDRSAQEIWEDIDTFIENTPSLREHRGEVVPRHNDRQPWRNVLDLRVTQQIDTFNGQSVELTANIFNVLNLLNDDWGEIQFTEFNNTTLFNFYGLNDEGKPVIAFPENYDKDDTFSRADLSSRWQLQLGLRYNF